MAEKQFGLKDLPSMPRERRLPFLWQYYRFHALILLAVLLFGGIFLHNMMTRPSPDLTVMALCEPLTPTDTAALEQSLADYFPDYDGDGAHEAAVLHRPLSGDGAVETGTMAIALTALRDGQAPACLLNDAGVDLLFTYGGLTDETGAPAASLDAVLRLPAADFPEFSIPTQEPLYFCRPILPQGEPELAALQADIFARLNENA